MFDNKVAVNIAYVIGNSPIRICAIGWHDTPATDPDVANMRAMLREGMEEGAFGISTGLDYPPGSYATTDELVSLSQEVARLGGIYHTHLRNTLGDRFLDPVKEALEIGKRAGLPCHLTHFYQRITHPGSARHLLELVDGSVDSGQDVTMDCFPYTYSSTRVLIMFPHWAHNGGPTRLKQVLRSEEGRERLREEVRPRGQSWSDIWLTYFKRPHNKRFEGKSVAEVADTLGKSEVDALCDLLLDEDLADLLRHPGPEPHHPPRLHDPPPHHGRHRRPSPRRLPQPQDLRHLPHPPLPLRPQRKAHNHGRGHTKDDLLRRPSASASPTAASSATA